MSPLCTVGAAELAPPASGTTALLPTVMEFEVFSSPLPEVAADDVVQFVSSFWLEGLVVCATEALAINEPAITVAAMR